MVKANPKKRKGTLSGIRASRVHQHGAQKRCRICAENRGQKIARGDGCGKLRLVGAPVCDHPAVQRFDPLAGGALAKAGDEGMQKAGATCEQQCAREGKGDALMFQIAFADRLRMGDKQASEHDQNPRSKPG